MKLRIGILCWLFLSANAPLWASEVAIGKTAPSCAITKMGGGGEKKLDSLKGQVVYVDFWASWCGPCAQSFPFMNQLHKELGPKGLAIIGINLDEKLADASGFLSQTPARFEIVSDVGGQCPQAFGVKAMPSSYLIDRQGVVRQIHLGFKPGEAQELRKEVEALLKEGGPSP